MVENIQIGLDLATALSIIGAASVFLMQFLKERRDKHKSEMWQYFKDVTNGISERKLKITEAVSDLKFRQEESLQQLLSQREAQLKPQDVPVAINTVKRLSNVLVSYIKYETKADLDNLLAYYDIKQSERAEIFGNYTNVVDGIEKFIDQLKTFEKTFLGSIDSLPSHDKEALAALAHNTSGVNLSKKEVESKSDEQLREFLRQELLRRLVGNIFNLTTYEDAEGEYRQEALKMILGQEPKYLNIELNRFSANLLSNIRKI